VLDDQPFAMLSGRHHGMRAQGVCAGQRRVVAADFRGRLLPVRQEKEVVNRDNLRRAPGRDEQRMRGVHDVEVAGHRFDRGPPRPMPEEVQYSNRDPPIDGRHPELRYGRW